MSFLNIHKNEILFCENIAKFYFVGKLRSIKFPDYLNHTCVNGAYVNFVSRF